MEIIIIGAGGHAKVIIDIIEKRKEKLKENISIVGVCDDNYSHKTFLGYKYLGKVSDIAKIEDWKDKKYIIAIGSNKVRKKIVHDNHLSYATLIHPSAIISNRVKIDEGTVIMAGTIINSSVEIGKHVILNTSCKIDHDCRIGDYVHISPGVILAGGVHIGEKSWIGVGTAIIQGIKVGDKSIIGAGSVVIKDIGDEKKVFGVPAREFNHNGYLRKFKMMKKKFLEFQLRRDR